MNEPQRAVTRPPQLVVGRHDDQPIPMAPKAAAAGTGSIQSLTWLGAGNSVVLRTVCLEIHDPLAFFCRGDMKSRASEPAAIDLSLPIAESADFEPVGSQLQYWPRYSQLSPEQRRAYLGWLSAGRTPFPREAGYGFLFFYGLERRSLADREDVKLIFKEVLRLRKLNSEAAVPGHGSFDRYASSLLWFLLVREPDLFALRHVEAVGLSTVAWDDDALASATSWLHRSGERLPGWLAFVIAGRLPKSQRSVVVKRVNEELRTLFFKRYKEQYGRGLDLKVAKRDRTFAYRPASAALSAHTFEAKAGNPFGILTQYYELGDLWNGCIADLKRLSTVMADGKEMTNQAWNALPPELKAKIDHPLTDAFIKFIEMHSGDSAYTIAPAQDLAALCGFPAEAKLTLATCRRITELSESVGYCVEPDPRITHHAFAVEDSVALFLDHGDGAVEPARYLSAAMMLNVGFALAQIDGHGDEAELSVLTQHVDSAFQLNPHEQRRLANLKALRIAKRSSWSDLIKPLKRLPTSERERVAKLALALVAADGVVTKEEVYAVRRLYSAMGFDRQQAAAALAAITVQPASSDEPVTVAAATLGEAGEPIPKPAAPEKPVGLQLDRSAIAAILRDTVEVSQMLADAMSGDSFDSVTTVAPAATAVLPEATVASATLPAEGQLAVEPILNPAPPASAAPPSEVVGLAPRYATFYQRVISKSQWDAAELAVIAKEQGLMLAGTLEAINDWSTETNGGPLIYEDGALMTLESAYLS